MKFLPIATAWAALCLTVATPVLAQIEANPPRANALASAPTPPLHAEAGETPASKSTTTTTTTTTNKPGNDKPLTARWLDLTTFSHAERYRNSYNQGGFHIFEDGQQRSLLQGRIKLDPEAHYTLGFRASSGRYFTWSYADYAGPFAGTRLTSPATNPAFVATFLPVEQEELANAAIADPKGYAAFNALHSNGWDFYLRELSLSATPFKPLTLEFGSFGFERGYSSEITTFDDDGYISGERLRLRDPKHLFFDEVGFTTAFFGDFETPNFFARTSSLGHANYRQVFAKKQLNPRIGFSGEYTRQFGINTLREGTLVNTGELKLIDSIRVEAYQRLNGVTLQGGPQPDGSGFAVTFQKKLGRVSGDLGYAAIDNDYEIVSGSRYFCAADFVLNGDTYSDGDRPFTHASYKINSVVTAFGYYTHAVGPRHTEFNQQSLNGGLSFDFKALTNAASPKRVF